MEDLVLQAATNFCRYYQGDTMPPITQEDVQIIINTNPFVAKNILPYDIILNLEDCNVYHIVNNDIWTQPSQCKIGDRIIRFPSSHNGWKQYLSGYLDGVKYSRGFKSTN